MSSTALESPPFAPVGDGERWPALMAFVTAGLLPATTARRTTQVSLGSAFLVHIGAALGAAVLICFFVAWEGAHIPVAWEEAPIPTRWVILGDVLLLADSIAEAFLDDPVGTLLAAAAIFISVEVGFLVLAGIVMPWGAADEPILESLKSALRRTYLHTPHAVIVIVLAGLLIVCTSRASRQAAWSVRPFYIRWHEEIAILACLCLAGWWIWGIFRSIGAPRGRTPIARPPMCESCGYNLTGIPAESICPECGEPAVRSLGPDVRQGPDWQCRGSMGVFQAWLRTTRAAIMRPELFGRQLRVCTPVTDHRRFHAWHLPTIALTAWIGVIVCYFADTGRNPFSREPEVVWIGGPYAAFIATVGAVFMTSAGAAVIGIWYSFKAKRNLMAGTIQAASYLSGYVVAWTVFSFMLLAGTFAAREGLRSLASAISLPLPLISFVAWGVPNLVCLAAYGWLIARVTSTTLYANK